MKIWKLKKGHDARLRSRHPWVFSNELMDSPKSVKPGEPVEVHDVQGHFMARGYGNPHSLISFRAISFSPRDENPTAVEFLTERLVQAWQYRKKCGFLKSFRLCYSEADQMPGLVLDRYLILKNNVQYQVFSFQLLTSGMDLAFQSDSNWEKIFKNLVQQSLKQGLSPIDWEHTIILQRNDVNIRKLEGIPVEEPKILKTIENEDLTDVQILVQNVLNTEEAISFSVNLIEGQKTGFFLDQTFNMKLLLEHLQNQKDILRSKKVRILDLCCYMGQWSAQIVANLTAWGVDCEVHLVDVSEMALAKAKLNVEKYKVNVVTHKKDVLNLAELNESNFDIVISDPPAFVKNKKDIHQGLNAYFKINAQAFKMCAPGAVVVSCTCSGLVQMEDFKDALRKSVLRSGRNARCVVFGGQGWDHPTLMSFPEGFYLKMVMHQVD